MVCPNETPGIFYFLCINIGNEFGGNDMKALGVVETSKLKCKM